MDKYFLLGKLFGQDLFIDWMALDAKMSDKETIVLEAVVGVLEPLAKHEVVRCHQESLNIADVLALGESKITDKKLIA